MKKFLIILAVLLGALVIGVIVANAQANWITCESGGFWPDRYSNNTYLSCVNNDAFAQYFCSSIHVKQVDGREQVECRITEKPNRPDQKADESDPEPTGEPTRMPRPTRELPPRPTIEPPPPPPPVK